MGNLMWNGYVEQRVLVWDVQRWVATPHRPLKGYQTT